MSARILLVEDDLLLSELLEMLLFGEGHDVVHTSNGADAVERLKAESFDLVVLDLMMPVMDGLRFLDHCRSTDLACPSVLVFSASTSPEVTERALRAGAAAVARKPVDREEFTALVKNLIGS